MNISLNWLKKYVDLPKKIDPKEFGLKLTLATVEVEGWMTLAESLDKVVVGKVVRLWEHPNADQLKMAEVALGEEKVQVVCGGINLKEGMVVALAKVGARVKWHGEGELITLEKTKIRGEESHGMICAANEIGLGEMFVLREKEILDLSDKGLKIGQPLAEALGLDDIIYDIDNKSLTNRPDLWGHYGLAREVAAIYDLPLKAYQTEKIKHGKGIELKVQVKESELCPRYLGVALKNIKVGPSPDWLVKDLQAVGLRSINNIVDITNYIMLDLGQPMHAFDAGLVKNSTIVVRRAKKGEQFTTLDGEMKKLVSEDLVIADRKRVVALAGVIGGENSGINEQTTEIIFEAANFEPFNIRKTSERHNVRTESSSRFEKSLDPEMADLALKKAVELALKCCPDASVASAVVDVYGKKPKQIVIKTSYDFINKRIGHEFTSEVIKDYLQRLGFEVKAHATNIQISVPSWRATKDVLIPEDIVEEVARMYGYDNLKAKMPKVAISLPRINTLRELERQIKTILVLATEAIEVHNYSFVTEELAEKIGCDVSKCIKLENPATEGQSLMRRSLIPGLVGNIINNYKLFDQINVFEIGRVFSDTPGKNLSHSNKTEVLPDQPLMAAGLIYQVKEIAPFYLAKGILEQLVEQLGLKISVKEAIDLPPYVHPHRAWKVKLNGQAEALVGELHPAVLQNFGFDKPIGFWQINLEELDKVNKRKDTYQPINKFPLVELDISVIVDDSVSWQSIRDLVMASQLEFIREISLFDVYKNDKIGVGNKSLAFHVVYQAKDRTLELAEVQKWHDKIVSELQKKLKAEVRQ